VLSDDELVEQILLGNENAAEELIKRYYTSILRYCRWHCSNLEKAEDLTQETFLKLFKNLSGYKGKKKFFIRGINEPAGRVVFFRNNRFSLTLHFDAFPDTFLCVFLTKRFRTISVQSLIVSSNLLGCTSSPIDCCK
jgi:hypothetical protein